MNKVSDCIMIPNYNNFKKIKLKFLLERNDGGVWGEDPFLSHTSSIVLRSTEQTIDGKWNIVDPAERDLSGISNLSYYKIRVDDLLITKSSGSKLHIGKTTLADNSFKNRNYFYSNFIQRLRVDNKQILPKYLWYVLNNRFSREQFVFMQNSTSGIGNINADNIGNLIILLPTLEEQKRIISLLDQKCEDIDRLVANLKIEINDINIYKDNFIQEAVTKGLNKSSKQIKVDVKWLDKIPEHWKLEYAKYYFNLRNTKGNINNVLLSPTQKYGVIPQTLYEEMTNASAVKVNENTDLSQFKTIHKGDFCISLRSFEGGFEYCDYEGVVSPAYTVFYPSKNIDRRFFKYLFKTNAFISEMNSHSLSLRDGKPISFYDFERTYIPIPPIGEQISISDILDKKCCEIDKILDLKQKQLLKVEEYKDSLIYEYITGKKEIKHE